MDKKEVKKRSSRIKSPEYRQAIGAKLREARQEKGYSLSDIKDMTTIPPKTTLEMEKGITINIDYYVEYAKAVEYDFDNLSGVGIELIPSHQLPKKKQERVFLTKKIREYIILPDFLGDGKTTEQIRKHMISLNLIDESLKSTEITGVMKNFVIDETVKVLTKIAGKNIYALRK